MKKYKVVILTAGIGSRLKDLTKDFNKALLPIGFKAAITHIIEKFDSKTEIVIAIGYKGELVKEYLHIAHPEYKFKFVKIYKFIGEGSGPANSLLKCKKYLNCPFIFSSVDTIVLEKPPPPTVNWIGVAKVMDTSRFSSVSIKQGYVINMLDKVKSDNSHAFIGLCGINDYKLFWNYLSKNKKLIQGELQISNGLEPLVSNEGKVRAIEFKWFDTGDLQNYTKTKQHFNKNIEKFDFSKTDEYIYFVKDRVIKYFKDENLNKRRIERSNILTGFTPLINNFGSHFLSYTKIDGTTLYNSLTDNIVLNLFDWLKNKFWKEIKLNNEDNKKFQEACHNFYYTKTMGRIKKYFELTNAKDSASVVNGKKVPKVYELLKKIDWKLLKEGTPSRFHGDLQFDNILVTGNPTKPFILLDWRPDFSGLNYGDLYYDLAKLYGGLILSYNLIKQGKFHFKSEKNVVSLNFETTNQVLKSKKLFEHFISESKYDMRKIKLLTSLIFLNMAPLHKDPFNFLLHFLGKLELSKILTENV